MNVAGILLSRVADRVHVVMREGGQEYGLRILTQKIEKKRTDQEPKAQGQHTGPTVSSPDSMAGSSEGNRPTM